MDILFALFSASSFISVSLCVCFFLRMIPYPEARYDRFS
jgi:hypothetical protein